MDQMEQTTQELHVYTQIEQIVEQILLLDDARHHHTCRFSIPGRCDVCLKIAALERAMDGIRQGVQIEIEALIRRNSGLSDQLSALVQELACIDLYRCHSAPLGQWVVPDDTLDAEATRRIRVLVDPLLTEDERAGTWYGTIRFMIARYQVSYHLARLQRWGIPVQEQVTPRSAAQPD